MGCSNPFAMHDPQQEVLKMYFPKLVKNPNLEKYMGTGVKCFESKDYDKFLNEAQNNLVGFFGVEPKMLKRVFKRKGKSELYTKEQIAQILVNNYLVKDLDKGLKDAEILLESGIGDFRFFEYENRITKESVGYRLEYVRQKSSGSGTD